MHMAAEQNCAFVTFSAREAAEAVRRGGGGNGEEGGKGGRRGGKRGGKHKNKHSVYISLCLNMIALVHTVPTFSDIICIHLQSLLLVQ